MSFGIYYFYHVYMYQDLPNIDFKKGFFSKHDFQLTLRI